MAGKKYIVIYKKTDSLQFTLFKYVEDKLLELEGDVYITTASVNYIR